MIAIEATPPLVQPPAWAVLERQLFQVMEDAVHPFLEKYTHPDGRLIWHDGLHHTRDGADDFYESFYNWPLLYLLGGGDQLLTLGQRQWEATTALMAEYGHVYKEYESGYDQFHQSESYIYFYLLTRPTPRMWRGRGALLGSISTKTQRPSTTTQSTKSSSAPTTGARGRSGCSKRTRSRRMDGYSPGMARYGLPYEDLEGIDEPADLKDPEKARRMGQAMKERMARGDCATNLHVTSLIANACYLTGDDKYRAWLLEYVATWIERATANGGLLPDNVGLSGQVGEYMEGRYGSMYGWTWPHGLQHRPAILAGTHCYVLTGEEKYLELPRTQLRKVLEQRKMTDLGQIEMSLGEHWIGQLTALGDDKVSFVVPYCYGAKGWSDFQPLAAMYPAALWNVSGAAVNWEMLVALRAKERYDWRTVVYALR